MNPYPEELIILIRQPDQRDYSRVSWTQGSLRFEDTRKSAVEFLKGLIEELEKEKP